MQLEINQEALPVYEALASNVRIKIIQLLAKNKMNVKELAQELGLSSAIITVHIKKLEEAKIIKTERVGQKKISSLRVDHIDINFPEKIFNAFDTRETSIPIGHYTNYFVEPTCGLATLSGFIGPVDEPKFFMDPNRMDGRILWFTKGFVEYQSPNFLSPDEKLEMMEISMEISSEFPFSNNNWPSDITFSLNGITLGKPRRFCRYSRQVYARLVSRQLKSIRVVEDDSNHGTWNLYGRRTIVRCHDQGYSYL